MNKKIEELRKKLNFIKAHPRVGAGVKIFNSIAMGKARIFFASFVTEKGSYLEVEIGTAKWSNDCYTWGGFSDAYVIDELWGEEKFPGDFDIEEIINFILKTLKNQKCKE